MRIDTLGSITGFIYRVVTIQIALGTDSCRGSTLLTPNLDLVSALSIVANDFSMNDIRISQRASSILSNIVQVKSHEDSKTHSVQSVWNRLNSILTNNATDILEFANELTASGLIPSKALTCLNGYAIIDLNSIHRHNPSPENLSIYPYKAKSDAPYSIAENTLRAAIHIPRSFSHKRDKKIPVLLVPGTAVPAAITFYFNFGKLRRALPESELVWIDLPQASLDDIQLSAEYVAYALNYVSALTSSKIAVISWSQGALDIQWALKYWPSTRSVVNDFIAISPDFHGTIVKWLVCPLLNDLACTPSIWQQGWDANFIQALRSQGGDSAYVTTTTIYSSFDKIVRPMSGENASARLLDYRGVGVSNNHLQTICANNAAGGLYTHEGVLYNPLAWALTVDALLHDGPSNITRIDTQKICEQVLPPYLELTDMLGTEALLLVALAKILTYSPKVSGEPDIAKYAY
ncbi:hypothetical protein F9C07_2255027 [Aspergillus flavus]|uniref:Lipase n=4 Tax=Aspergillus subgen. Circumdati TaxID=2720871 RepID=A0A7U2QVK5_ASPFN|nr:hypothetical protein AFLA_005472 [Aspergillus flavus NRRL3357]KAJ1713652.1 lipase [Aspergillus flavus]GMG12791.1 unnamed protein product [Aspergillus oryzae]GMG52971.1 unnamed protein product [Aspergillus oryzae var. brunneus]QRD86174.1 hypothetical protein F9C07_2255027 [Aspergillus flavus]